MKSSDVSIEDLLSGKVRLEFGNEGQLTAIKNYELKKNRCQSCDGEGSTCCSECDGDGTIECNDCDGTGEA